MLQHCVSVIIVSDKFDANLYPVYTMEQTSSRHRTNVEQTSSWLIKLTYSSSSS